MGAKVVAPMVATTCSSGRGRMLDYLVASKGLANRISIEVDWNGPWAPHRGLFATISGGAYAPLVRQLVVPRPIPRAKGPDQQTLQQHLAEEEGKEEPVFQSETVPVDRHSQEPELTRMYGTFASAAERMLLKRSGNHEEQRNLGRGEEVIFKVVPQQRPNRTGAVLAEKEAAVWAAIAQRIMEFRRFKAGVGETQDQEAKELTAWVVNRAGRAANGEWGFQPETAQALHKLAQDESSLGKEELRELTEQLRGIVVKKLRALKASKEQDFVKWVGENLANGAKMLHKWATNEGNQQEEESGLEPLEK